MDDVLATTIKKYCTLCLAQGFDEALTAAFGDAWFDAFLAAEAEEDHPITHRHFDNVYSLDFQALLKILYYRPAYARAILEHFGYLNGTEDADRQGALNHRLRALMHLYRNRMDAHTSARAVSRSLSDDDIDASLYTHEHAVNDMLIVASIFRSVKDEQGNSYYDQMNRAVAEHRQNAAAQSYPIAAVIEANKLHTDPLTVFQICGDLEIPASVIRGQYCFTTDNYALAVERIRNRLQAKTATDNSRKTRRRAWIIVGTALLLTVTVVLFAFSGMFSAPSSLRGENAYYNTAELQVVKNKIDLQIQQLYWDGNTLVAECAIINGLSEPVTRIDVPSFSIENRDGLIAEGQFGTILNGQTLAETQYLTHIFRFTDVSAPGADLTGKLYPHCDIAYR